METRVFLDSDLLSTLVSSMNFQIKFRASAHTLEAILTDVAGRELARSEVRTFLCKKPLFSTSAVLTISVIP